MSGRSKKTSAVTVTSKITSSPVAAEVSIVSATRSPHTGRPASPTMISRVQEKNELASLNDRLATYIERVRQLESENTRLTRIVETQAETVTKETSGIKSLYEEELASARRLLDELAKEKAKLQFENGKFKAEVEDLREKLRAKEKDLALAEEKVLAAESQITELQARLNDTVNQRRHWEDEYNKIKKELDVTSKSLITAKKQLEDETIMRVDHENRIQTMKEELAFISQVHEKELNESMVRSRVVFDEVDGRLQEDYTNKLQESLQQMRDDMEEQLRQSRLETEAVYDRKLAEMRALAERNVDTSDKTQAELRNSRKRIDELSSEVSRLTAQNQSYEARINQLESQLKRDQDSFTAERDALNAEVQRLRAAMEDQLIEYRDLMDIKIQLDTEIAAYRKLLESEETRLNLSTTQTSTPGRGAGDSSRKRKRLDETDSVAASSSVVKQLQLSQSDFEVYSSAKEVVEISEVSSDGKFIKLFNTSNDKEVSLAGWLLKHTGKDKTTTYKFPRSVHVKPQQYVTVWSSDANQAHAPPSNLVMKDQKWNADDQMQTSLLDAKGEELANHSMKRSAEHTSSVVVEGSSSSEKEQQKPQRKGWGWSLFSVLS